MSTHKQVSVNGIEVDEGIAEMLRAVWAVGIETQHSCQGGDGERDGGMIVFPTAGDAIRFMTESLDSLGRTDPYTFTNKLTMELWPSLTGGPWRATVHWPHQFTPVWVAAWSGTPMLLQDILDNHCEESIDEMFGPIVEAITTAGIRQYCNDLATEYAYHEPGRDLSLLDRFHDDAESVARYIVTDGLSEPVGLVPTAEPEEGK